MPIYMKYDGIDGSVTQKGHEKWIEILSCQFGAARSMTTLAGRAADREASEPSISEVVITKPNDDASAKLFEEAVIGTDGKKVTIEFVSTGSPGVKYLDVKLENVLVSSYTMSGSSGDGRPMESVSLNFTKVMISHYKMDQKGAVTGSPIIAGYDVAKAAKM
ncbi:MAG: type VI secretion system tube protein Hcp [Alphaproteobacteria bacterium]|nr:type VI secretion system tube protein Hcp [Alphaproteobacteria bacterium]